MSDGFNKLRFFFLQAAPSQPLKPLVITRDLKRRIYSFRVLRFLNVMPEQHMHSFKSVKCCTFHSAERRRACIPECIDEVRFQLCESRCFCWWSYVLFALFAILRAVSLRVARVLRLGMINALAWVFISLF